MNLEYLQLQELLGGGGGTNLVYRTSIVTASVFVVFVFYQKPNYQIIKLLRHVINELSAD